MTDWVVFALAGFAASLVDGALGMGFGPTSSSILLGSGLAPAAVSASVNLSKVATGLVSGLSHWRFRNVDRKLVLKLAIPGCLGALGGATILSTLNGAVLRPYLAMLLSVVGLRILVRFARPLPPKRPGGAGQPEERGRRYDLQYDERGVTAAALAGGVTNGLIGAWGPVVTPFLLHRNVRPRFAIGCVNTAEIAVASTAAFSLLATLGGGGLQVGVVVAMLVGGGLAAPVAAWVIRYVPPGPMGVLVAGLLLLTNARDLMAWGGLSSRWGVWMVYGVIVAAVCTAFRAAMRNRSATAPATEADPSPVRRAG